MKTSAIADSEVGEAQCKTVLIIEDDESIRETLGFFLEFEGYKVFTAAHGKEGLNLLSAIPKPCLILLDLMMPVMDGWGFIAAIQKDTAYSAIPVFVVTAFGDKAKTIHANGIINKPVDLDRLSEVVKTYCG
jgi:CheY-like chemotaxis protein